MKKIKYIPLLISLIGLAIGFNSCDEENLSKEDFEWKAEAMTLVMPGEYRNFFYATNADAFIVEELDFNISVLPASANDADAVDKLEVYAFLQETDGDVQVMHGGESGKLFKTYVDIPDFSEFQVHVTIDELYELFKDDLLNKNRPNKLVSTDLIEFKWVITDKSGKVTDTRMDCSGSNCQYILGVDTGFACPNDLSGVLNYEVLEKGSGATGSVGQTGSVEITRVSLSGDYTIDDCQFGTSYNGNKFGCKIKDKDCGSLLDLDGADGTEWEITNINGPTCDITWTYSYTDGYDEWAKVRVTRADGQDWPIDLKGEGPY
ncbi:hypothetical protein [Ancylomarina euxinus]|nr:hypothetical protein [Ancylomarina euxinus]MCZ4695567.1 hypothetical protein [Ancylomarina euxinus]MUP15948.1 hypothetical protein [Ancylomarina euxinus]